MYHLELKDFIQNLYHDSRPSRYLASFAKFAGENQSHPYICTLVKGCFTAFLESSVCRYEGCKTMKISFVGSVASHFSDLLKETLDEQGLILGEIMASPADGLVRYYGAMR